MRQVPPLLLRPKLHHFGSSCDSDHRCSLLITLLGLTLVLPPPVALETEHVLPDRPALLPLHPRVQHHPAVLRVSIVSTDVVVINNMLRIYFHPHLTLEAVWMEVFVQCVDS